MASSSSSGFAYDVFLSYRGEDTRKTFTSHLYAALQRKNITTFMADDTITRGTEISSNLLNAIEQWCLQELEAIIINKKKRGQIVIPVFYGVEPSEVRWVSGRVGEAFRRFETYDKEKLDSWKTALSEVANLSGWDSSVVR
ncbi:hypothetical protein Pint_04586 [Pistacia integerrima]|uniref:Uncharacterized protein n=1 Tax=Pistacia integerrima TaxID=434235 RepID=A0ACC0Z6P0_9ROSI|nr:hypothetical protein Pint_04586 [Pistacia integerrima]